jgi:hypothetical protein
MGEVIGWIILALFIGQPLSAIPLTLWERRGTKLKKPCN